MRADAGRGTLGSVSWRPLVLVPLVLSTALAPATIALARGGDDARVRQEARCGRAASLRLELRARDGAIRTRFALEHGRRGETWRSVLVQEDRVVWRGSRRLAGSGAFEVELRLRDLPGVDRVAVRTTGPHGTVCRVAATLRG